MLQNIYRLGCLFLLDDCEFPYPDIAPDASGSHCKDEVGSCSNQQPYMPSKSAKAVGTIKPEPAGPVSENSSQKLKK